MTMVCTPTFLPPQWRPLEAQEGHSSSPLCGSQLWTGLNPEKGALDRMPECRPPEGGSASVARRWTLVCLFTPSHQNQRSHTGSLASAGRTGETGYMNLLAPSAGLIL